MQSPPSRTARLSHSSYRSTTSFFFTHTATTSIYTLSLHDALPISRTRSRGIGLPRGACRATAPARPSPGRARHARSEEHTSELQSRGHLVCRLLLEKKKNTREPIKHFIYITRDNRTYDQDMGDDER